MTRHKFRIIRFVIFLIALAIGNDITVNPNSVTAINTTNTPHSTANFANAIHLGIQSAQADQDEDDCRWSCPCQYYSDHKKHLWNLRGEWAGAWHGHVKADGRGSAENRAEEKCEKETADKGVDCWLSECSCGDPRPRGRCDD